MYIYIHLIYTLYTVDSIDLVFEILGSASIQHPRTCLAETRHLSQGYPEREKVGPVGTNCSFRARCQELKDGKSPSTADAFIQVAYEFFEAGREAWRMKGWAQPRWFCQKIKKRWSFFSPSFGNQILTD